MQILYRDISGYSILPPILYEPNAAANIDSDDSFSVPAYATAAPYTALNPYTALPSYGFSRMDTIPVGDLESGSYTFKMNADAPYQPFPYSFTQSPPYDLYIFPDGSKRSLSFFIDKQTDYGLHIYLPAYIPFYTGLTSAVSPCTGIAGPTAPCAPTIKAVYVKYVYEDDHVEVVNITNLMQTDTAKCDAVASYSLGSGQPVDMIAHAGLTSYESWCISANAKTQNRPMMSIKAYTGAGRDWKIASVIIDFKPIERNKGTTVTQPGNPYYYLTKLAKLELIGIPQITYEPLYCNSDQNQLVPGIFSSSIKTRAQFESNTNSFVNSTYNTILNYDEEGSSLTDSAAGIGNNANRMTYQDKLAHSAVFSAKDFACCTPLGKTATSAAKCCSATGSTVNGVTTCKLPTGTDLNVYFNKFVSSEGVGDTEPGGGLVVTGTEAEIDFNQYTGEPKMRTSTYLKLEELGKSYCLNGVVGNGGSFGQFPPEPYSGYNTTTGTTLTFPMSIVDSIIDSEAGSTNVGKFPFDNGYRWDNHYYCK